MRNEFASWVKLVDNPVGVFLNTGCKDDNFVELGHLLKELATERPDQEVWILTISIVNIVDQGFIEVQNKRVFPIRGKSPLIRWALNVCSLP